MIFKNIQDEFESTRVKLDRAETHLVPRTGARHQTRKTVKPGIPRLTEEQPPPPLYGSGGRAPFVIPESRLFRCSRARFPRTTTTNRHHNVPLRNAGRPHHEYRTPKTSSVAAPPPRPGPHGALLGLPGSIRTT